MNDCAPARYTCTAITLHWMVFVLVACAFMLAVYMNSLPLSPLKLQYVAWHKWAGVTIFFIAVLRLLWRATHRPPALPASIPVWERSAAAIMHALLYALILMIPLSGWLYSAAAGVPTAYLGILHLPSPLARDRELAELLRVVHISLNYTMLVLVIVHAAAAFKHALIDRDDVLGRMLPWATRGGGRR